jgi:hypothetical protein
MRRWKFWLAAIAQSGVESSDICLHVAQEMRVAEVKTAARHMMC